MKRQILALICVAALLVTGGGNSVSVQAAKKVVSLSKKNVALKVGQNKKITVKKTAKVKIKSKTFTSSNTKVASVTKKTGKIKAKKAGKATITVKVKYIKKQNRQKKAVVLKCKVVVIGNHNNSDTTRTNETVLPNQSIPGSGMTESPMPTGVSGNVTSEPRPILPTASREPENSESPTEDPQPESSESPTEEPQPGKDGVIETETFDDFAQAAAQLVKDNKSSNGSGIAASDEFYTKRLIVKGKDADLSFEAYKPIAVVKSSDNIFMVQFETASAAKTAMGELRNLPNVEYVEADSYSGASVEGENGSKKFNSWGVSKIGADQYAEKIASNVNQEVEVAVVDTGVSSHEFLDGRISDKGMDFVDVDIIPNDLNGHGTHVAGTIVDCTPNLNVKIVPVRVLDGDGSGYSSIVGMGIRYAVNCGAKVINLSLGGGHSQYIDDNINYAIKKGVTVVVAAGNEYGNTSDYCPSHLTNVIVVGAVDENDKKAGFSNTGSSLDVVAPGVDIVSCVPGGGYKSYDGTSMATPHISAIAAMFALVYPEKQPSEIEEMIKGCTRDLGEKGWDKQYGHGIPDLSSSGIVPTELTLDKFNIMMKVGDTETLTATVLPNGVADKSVLWSSSDSSIVSVQGGILEAKAAGNVIITAETVNGKSATCNVVVSRKDREAGLYDASTNEMKKSWEELISDEAVMLSEDGKTVLSANGHVLDGVLVIEDGIEEIASGNSLDDDFRGFKDCSSLVGIEMPDSIVKINFSAFNGCENLKNIRLSNDVTLIGARALEGCSNLQNIEIPDHVATIGAWAFSECTALKEITVPESVTSIGYAQDMDGSYSSWYIGGVFSNCSSLENIVVAETNGFYDSRENCNAIIETKTNTLAAGCKNTLIPESVTAIGYHAFAHCEYLQNIEMPKNITTISEYAFYGCNHLKNIKIPSGVEEITEYSFYECSGLESITIPSGIKSIGSQAFKYCSGLETINVSEGNTVYDSRNDCNAIIETQTNKMILGCKNTIIPDTVTDISGAFEGCSGLRSVQIPNSIASIGSNAFYGCNNLTDIKLPETITEIGWGAFHSCGMSSIILPDQVIKIGSQAFYGCAHLTEIIIPDNVTQIGEFAFGYCTNLQDVQIPNGLTSIDGYAFYACSSLEDLEVPDSVTTIGEKAFYEVPLVIYDGSAEGKPWGAKKVQNSYGTSKSIFKMGNKKLALGMSRADLYTVLGGSLSHELRTGLAPQGFDTIAFNTKDYKEYLLVYLKDERVTGICGIGKEMSFNGAVAGKNSNTLGSNWKNLNEYKTSSGKISAKKISLSNSEQAYAFYDVLGDNTIYCIQVFDPTKVKDQDHDMIYMTENLSYDATVCNSIATEIGHMLNAFRMYCNINTFSLHSGLAQCAQNYCNSATGSKLNARGEPALINAIEAAGTDPSAWGEVCYYDAGDAISFANSLIELDDFYLVLINTKEVDGWTPIWGYAGVGMAANGKHAYITIDYVDEV